MSGGLDAVDFPSRKTCPSLATEVTGESIVPGKVGCDTLVGAAVTSNGTIGDVIFCGATGGGMRPQWMY